jgi:hypothetical protein
MAEREGFEPSGNLSAATRSPGVPVKPLPNLSKNLCMAKIFGEVSPFSQNPRRNGGLSYIYFASEFGEASPLSLKPEVMAGSPI